MGRPELTAIADTGAQTCTSGRDILLKLGCSEKYLLKTHHRIKGITNSRLSILGILVVKVESGTRKTTQLMYICDNTDGIYLSLTALKELGMIARSFLVADKFPEITRGASQECLDQASSANSSHLPSDTCPKPLVIEVGAAGGVVVPAGQVGSKEMHKHRDSLRHRQESFRDDHAVCGCLT